MGYAVDNNGKKSLMFSARRAIRSDKLSFKSSPESRSSSSSQNPQNVAFVSSNSTNSTNNTNKADNTAYGVNTAHTQDNTVNFTSGDNLSYVVICAFLASQSNSPQLALEEHRINSPDDITNSDFH
ncbi:hypothetical protein Tco_1354337 [Tanacetum coccineum]